MRAGNRDQQGIPEINRSPSRTSIVSNAPAERKRSTVLVRTDSYGNEPRRQNSLVNFPRDRLPNDTVPMAPQPIFVTKSMHDLTLGNPSPGSLRTRQSESSTNASESFIHHSLRTRTSTDSSAHETDHRLSLPRMQSRTSRPAVDQSLFYPPGSWDPRKVLLVIDVDETIVHGSLTPKAGYDFVLNVAHKGEMKKVFVKLRPHLRTFLQFISTRFEICFFTASVSEYANLLLNRLDPGALLGTKRLFRQHCTLVDGAYVKDLARFGKPMHRIVMLDNSPASYLFQPENGMAIESYYGDDPNDTGLQKVIPILRRLSDLPPDGDVCRVLMELQS